MINNSARKLSISEVTHSIVNVQLLALNIAEHDIRSGVNIYARNALRLLHSLGANKEQLTNLVEEVYNENVQPLDDGIGDACIGVFTLAHMLSTDLQQSVYRRLCEVINSPKEHEYSNSDIFEVV